MKAKRGIVGSIISRRTLKFGAVDKTLRLENAFWTGLEQMAVELRSTVGGVLYRIYRRQGEHKFESAVRIYVLRYFRRKWSRAQK